MPPETATEVDFEKGDGLVPCIAQDARTGRVLMLAYMNEEALERTLETGQVHYWSRSRQELWRKGETSGHTQELVALHHDCDRDTILALVHQTGPACHTGKPSCFFTRLAGGAAASRPRDAGQGGEEDEAPGLPILLELWQVIEQRAEDLPEGSWTTRLLTEEGLVEGKVLEEASEVVDRAGGQGEDPLAHEIADLLYHVLVLGAKHGVGLEDVMAELEARRG